MVDTSKIWLPDVEIKSMDTFAEIPNYLSEVTTHQRTGKADYITGKLGNMRVGIYEHGVSIQGSLPKFLWCNNFRTPTRKDIYQAIEKGSDLLHLGIKRGNVTRLDFGFNLVTAYPPSTYYPYLGQAPYLKRLEQPNSIYYQSKQRQFVIYDKVKEANRNKEEIPSEFLGKQVVRMEYRLLRNIGGYFNLKNFQVSDLWSKVHFNEMGELWEKMYLSISKNSLFDFDQMAIKTPNDLYETLTCLGIKSHGGESKILEFVDELKNMNAFSNPRYYNRAKQKIRKLCQKESGKNNLIEELDSKVKNAR